MHEPDKPTTESSESSAESPKQPTDPIRENLPWTPNQEEAARFALQCARLLRDNKCENVIVLDVHELSDVTDFVIIGSGTSDRQMNSTLEELKEIAGEVGRPAYSSSKDERSTWLLADFVDVVVHLFEPNTRAYYDLEMLWGDAPRVDWHRSGEKPDTDTDSA